MKVALIHDHLAQDGGAEKVLRVLADIYPEAPIYTLLYEPANVAKYFKHRSINTSIIQRMPGGIRFYKWFMPFMPVAVEFFNMTHFDLVISDTSSFAKGVITPTHTPHICYCHTPTRYLWSDTHSYIEELRFNKYLKKLIALSLNNIRVWDKAAADRVDYFIANSHFIAKRIKKYYRRDSVVIYPPVEVDQFTVQAVKEDYYLAGGRLVPYKRFDLVIESFKKSGMKLKIFGDGPDFDRLVKMVGAAANIEFLGRVSEKDKVKLYAGAKGFINPQEEDFGITMVEALASGTPVLAFRAGGAPEIVVEGETGFLFSEQEVASLDEAIASNEKASPKAEVCRQRAELFSSQIFREKMAEYVAWAMDDYKKW